MAETWRDSNYGYRKEITVQNANIDGDLTDFPVLIAWASDTDINTTGSKVQADLDDIRFYDGSGTLLKFEVNNYTIDGTDSTASVWVKKPTLKTSPAGNDNKIWMYYGYASATNGEDAANTWEANFVAVWHLEENPDDGFSDSSGNGHSGTEGVAAMTSTDSVAGQVGNAIDLDGASDHIDFGDDAAFSFGDGSTDSPFSVSFWANFDDTDTQMPIGKYDGGLNEWAIYMFSSSGINFNLVDESTNAQIGKYGTGSMPTGSWNHWGATYDGSGGSGGIELYKDGASNYGGTDDSGSYTAMENLTTKLLLGYRATDTAWAVDGTIDEMRLSSVERSAAWIKFECFNMNEADNELTWSAEEEPGGGPTMPVLLEGGMLRGGFQTMSGGM